ncbi:TonB-dependent receptor [Methylophaga sp. 41_12_T18]|nr:TonB-dependent receptor [Methylophaga sp. 41_12_T18]
MFRVKKLAIAVTATAIVMPSSLLAETVTLDELVVTGTKQETSLMDLAGNTATVNEEAIKLLNADHIQESLSRIAGVNIQRGNGAESLVALRSPVLTGPGAGGAFLFMEDGIALRSAGFANNNGLAEAHYEMAGDIEVVKGPGSALYGSNAVHGLFNILSLAPSAELEREIGFSVGSDDLHKVKGTISDTVGAHAYRVSFSGTDDNGWRDESGYGQQKVTARHDYFADSGDSFRTLFSAFNLNQETAGFIKSSDEDAYEDRSLMETNDDEDAYRDWWSMRLSTRWDHELANGNLFSLTPYVRSTKMEFRQHYLPSRAIEQNEHQSVGVQAAYYVDLDGGHKVIFGTDLEYTEGSLRQEQERASYSYFGKNRQQGIHYDYDVAATTVAPYVHAEWQLADKFRATTGVRFEHVRYSYDNNVADGTGMADGSACFAGPSCLYNRPADRDDTFNDWSPKLGLVYRLAETHSVFANLSRGHRAPQTTDLYRLQNQQVVGDMDSEQLDSLEIGVRGDANILSYELTAFYMKKKNFFFRDSAGLNVTDGKTKHKGIEASITIPLGEQFDLSANYTYAEHKYDFDNAASGVEDGNYVDTAPRNISNVRLGWDINSDSRAELEWSHIGRYYLDPSNAHQYDGHDVVNLRANTQITANLAIHAQIKNLLDEEYADRADFAFGDYRFFPAQDRNVQVGATYSF